MSVKAMAIVWESNLNEKIKITLLAYADHADHEGNNIFPSLGLIAWKCGCHIDTARRRTKKMIKDGHLISKGESRLGTNQYSIPLDLLPKLPPYMGTGKRGRPEIINPDNPRNLQGLDSNPSKTESNPPTAMQPDPSLEPSIKDSPPANNKPKKPKSEYVLSMEHLEAVFSKERPCSAPIWEGVTQKEARSINKLWRTPLKTIWVACDKDINQASFIVVQAIRKMKEDRLTFSKPIQILETAESIISDQMDTNPNDPSERNLTEERLARA